MKKHFKPLLIFAAVIGYITAVPFQGHSIDMPEESQDVSRSDSYHAGLAVEVIEKIPLPKGYHEGLFLDGENIWVNNGENINTWMVSPRGEIIGEIVPPGTFSEGITDSSVPGRFWITDWNTKILYRVAKEDFKMVSDVEISLEPVLPAGVVRVNDKLYVITWTRGITGTKYHLLQIDKSGDVTKRMRIRGISEPSQICWDGKYLWITSWFTRRVFQVDPNDFRVLGHFVSPAKDTTGIVSDGEYFWITGTYDDLYKIKVERVEV